MPTLRIFAAAFVLALPALVISHAQQPAIPTVNVITAEKRPVTESVRFVGRIQAIERVDIRARVTGYLEDVLSRMASRSRPARRCTVSRGVRLRRLLSRPRPQSCARRRNSTTPCFNSNAPKIC
jgi:hypothetical protein